MAKPWAFCSSGRLSATKARNGCMLALMVPSSTQSSPAAIQTDGQLGIKTRASDARIAPPRINGRRRPSRVQMRSLDCPIKRLDDHAGDGRGQPQDGQGIGVRPEVAQPHRFQIRRFGAADGKIRRLRDIMPLQNFPPRRESPFPRPREISPAASPPRSSRRTKLRPA
jgi:hypothetical protein